MAIIKGTRSRLASRTPAWSSAAAVPDVTTTNVGRPLERERPRAKNAADRSSRRTCVVKELFKQASASGVERDPGQRTTSVTPPRSSSSTKVAQNVAWISELATLMSNDQIGDDFVGFGPSSGDLSWLHPDLVVLGSVWSSPWFASHHCGR